MDGQAIRPHDLLWLTESSSLELDGPWPAWLTPDWLRRAPLVVRRENTPDGRVPVGLRGSARGERCKGYLGRAGVARRVTPEMLAGAGRRRHLPGLAALDALAALAPALDAIGLAWGPTGGVGFFLACGLPVLRQDSDLDLVVRAPQPLSPSQAAALGALQRPGRCRIDIQVDTGDGAFALAEWSRPARRVLLKTGAGPVLSDDPWGTLP
jgi:phosphoribosyl-dephospho-CoA transferase